LLAWLGSHREAQNGGEVRGREGPRRFHKEKQKRRLGLAPNTGTYPGRKQQGREGRAGRGGEARQAG
jgi:hypothetical protein